MKHARLDNREDLGKIVRAAWVEYCIETGRTERPDRIAPWEAMDEWSKEVDRRIGERVVTSTRWHLDEALQENETLHERVAELEAERDAARRAAAARLRAVKRMRKIAESYRPHALQHRANYAALLEMLRSGKEDE